ncbi:hypothetical protein B0T14DRAFT_499331 [Immersiella caudata]|uniref:Uncharacterized protein n=1 Tax=Immersiella caudata TaxID=314043 RepID=A0AA40BUC3_9PEZI|nr:hypothetical protein B0T14DRAFT_499331 [Immersiella caudata]
MCFKNEIRILTKASSPHDGLVEELKALIPERDFITQRLFQPLPKLFGHLSAAAGGNVMGVERQAHNATLFLAVIMAKTEEQAALARPKVKRLDWAGSGIHLNHRRRDPVGSSGSENV